MNNIVLALLDNLDDVSVFWSGRNNPFFRPLQSLKFVAKWRHNLCVNARKIGQNFKRKLMRK